MSTSPAVSLIDIATVGAVNPETVTDTRPGLLGSINAFTLPGFTVKLLIVEPYTPTVYPESNLTDYTLHG